MNAAADRMQAGELCAALEASAREWLAGEADRGGLAASACAHLVQALARDLERLFAALRDGKAPLRELPEAVRCAGLLEQRWRRQAQRLLTRLQADRALLADVLGGPRGAIVAIDTGLSEPHAGGATVLRLRDAQGHGVMYKPRSLALDAAWFTVVERLRERGLPLARQPRCVPRDGYGWVEHKERVACRDAAQVLSYAQGAGGTLALAWLLGACDLHDGNLLATPEGPVLLDLETLLQPDRDPAPGPLADSVLRAGLLPQLEFDAALRPADVGALGGLFGGLSNGNYDFEAGADAVGEVPVAQRPDAGALADAVCTGFARVAEAVRSDPQLLLGTTGAWQGLPVRLVLRDTRIYLDILRRSLQPAWLRSDTARQDMLRESLTVATVDRASLRQAITQELADLEALDVPVLHALSDGTGLWPEASPAAKPLFARSGCEALAGRLGRLSADAELRAQLALIRASFAARAASLSIPVEELAPRPFTASEPPWDDTACDAAVAGLLATLDAQAVWAPDGSVTWLAPVPGRHGWAIASLGADAEHGRWGIACFLAAAAPSARPRVAQRARDLALAALHDASRPAAAWTTRPTPAARAHLARVLHATGASLRERGLCRAAQSLVAPGANDRQLAADRAGSDGAARLLLARLDLQVEHDARAWGDAVAAALHAFVRETASARAVRLAWSAAALALLRARLGGAAPDPEPLALASLAALPAGEALPVELQLAWLRMSAELPALAPRERMQAALQDAAQAGLPALDGMQAGAMCVADRLLAAHAILGWQPALAMARGLAAAMLARADGANGLVTLPGGVRGATVPGLAMGLAGIGLVLLRLRHPAGFPGWRAAG